MTVWFSTIAATGRVTLKSGSRMAVFASAKRRVEAMSNVRPAIKRPRRANSHCAARNGTRPRAMAG